MITFEFWKDGKRAALTFSYDDGTIEDIQLIDILDKYSLKGTFNLNSIALEKYPSNHVKKEDLNKVYKNHEIACHGYNHLAPTEISDMQIINDITLDRLTIEKYSGRIIRGYAFPFGAYGPHEADVIKSCGIAYARTTKGTKEYRNPLDFMKWDPTAHHTDAFSLAGNWNMRVNRQCNNHGLFFIWGHSYEFREKNNWNQMEEFCKSIAFNENVWYATNIEIYEYRTALRQLIFSADQKTVYNPTRLDLWIGVDAVPVKISAGETVNL